MADFNTEDYLSGMEDAEKLTGNADTASASDTSAADNPSADTQQAKSQENSESTSEAASEGQADGDALEQAAKDDTLTPLGKAKAEAAEYLDALQRERAAFVNFRNRAAKEQDRYREHGIVDVLTALLPALDDIDRIRANSDIDESFAAVAAKIDKTFEKFGVEKFGEAGETFDPLKHEAILRKPDVSASEEVVDTVVEAGYRIGERIIRAARVVVAVPHE